MTTRKHRWIWILLFIGLLLLLGSLATSWNVVLVSHSRRMFELAHRFSSEGAAKFAETPWAGLILGTLGFAAALGGLILFFARLLKEMRLNQLQSEFLATVSHELKTPLAALEVSSSLLRSSKLTDEETERLWRSHEAELKRLREDVEALLEAARWQSTRATLKKAPMNLEAWITGAFERWKLILGPGASLKREGAPLATVAELDPRTLDLIADNLIENARKFAKGAPEVVVETLFTQPAAPGLPARWQIRFHDSGWGFDPSLSQKIFRRFYRARTDAPYSIPGTGLGLYLAASASRALGIKLKGESPGTGKGAVFTLEGTSAPGAAP